MSSPFVGEIRMFGGNFAPAGWAFCDGALMPISENETLFNLIGTTYGGDGQNTFAVPDLRSRVPVHAGSGFVLAQVGGVETVTLTTNQIPSHSHVPLALISADGNKGNVPASNAVLAGGSAYGFSANPPDVLLAGGSIAQSGGSQPHDNMVPFLAVNFIISLFGIFPSQN